MNVCGVQDTLFVLAQRFIDHGLDLGVHWHCEGPCNRDKDRIQGSTVKDEMPCAAWGTRQLHREVTFQLNLHNPLNLYSLWAPHISLTSASSLSFSSTTLLRHSPSLCSLNTPHWLPFSGSLAFASPPIGIVLLLVFHHLILCSRPPVKAAIPNLPTLSSQSLFTTSPSVFLLAHVSAWNDLTQLFIARLPPRELNSMRTVTFSCSTAYPQVPRTHSRYSINTRWRTTDRSSPVWRDPYSSVARSYVCHCMLSIGHVQPTQVSSQFVCIKLTFLIIKNVFLFIWQSSQDLYLETLDNQFQFLPVPEGCKLVAPLQLLIIQTGTLDLSELWSISTTSYQNSQILRTQEPSAPCEPRTPQDSVGAHPGPRCCGQLDPPAALTVWILSLSLPSVFPWWSHPLPQFQTLSPCNDVFYLNIYRFKFFPNARYNLQT